MGNPIDFMYAIKFVDGDLAENPINATGDLTFVIVAAIFALIAIASTIALLVRRYQLVASNENSSQCKSRLQIALMMITTLAVAFCTLSIWNISQANAVNQSQTVEAKVFDDGSVLVDPFTLTNTHDRDIKFQETIFDVCGAAASDAEMAKSYIEVKCDGVLIFKGNPSPEPFTDITKEQIIKAGQTVNIEVSISNLTADVANGYLDTEVYMTDFIYKNAEENVPYPDATEPIVYDGKFHNGVVTEGENWNPDWYEISASTPAQQDVLVNEITGETDFYFTEVNLKPGFAWMDGSHDPFIVKWQIMPAGISLSTGSFEISYDMLPHDGSTDSNLTKTPSVSGLIEERWLDPEGKTTAKETVGFKNSTVVTHHYQCLDDDDFVGAINAIEIDFNVPAKYGQVRAKASNYNLVKQEFGRLKIKQIQFKHFDQTSQTYVDGVYAPDQSYEYIASPQGQPITYATLEEIEKANYDWEAIKNSEYKLESESFYSEQFPVITNVSASTSVDYIATSKLKCDEGLVEGDYFEARGSYYLEITKRDLNFSEITILRLNGVRSSQSGSEVVVNGDVYNYTGSQINPDFKQETGGSKSLAIYINSERAQTDIADFEITGDSTFDYGEKTATLAVKDSATNSNFSGSVTFPYYIHQLTEITYNRDRFKLYKGSVDEADANLIPPSPDGRNNNPLYGDSEDDTPVIHFDNFDWTPYEVIFTLIYFEGGPSVEQKIGTYNTNNQKLSIPKNEAGLYPISVEVKFHKYIKLTFKDDTSSDNPAEDGLAENGLYSKVFYSNSDQRPTSWSEYNLNDPLYFSGEAKFHVDSTVADNIIVYVDESAFGQTVRSWFYVSLGVKLSDELDTTPYVSQWYNIDYYTYFDDFNVVSDFSYSLTPKYDSQSVSYHESHTEYQVAAEMYWAAPWLHTDTPTCTYEFGTAVYIGQVVSFIPYNCSTDQWNPNHGWCVRYGNGLENTIYPDIENKDFTNVNYSVASNWNYISVEPFVLLQPQDTNTDTPASFTYTVDGGEAQNYDVTKGLYAPTGQNMLTKSDDALTLNSTSSIPFLVNKTSETDVNAYKDANCSFTVVPQSGCSASWDNDSYSFVNDGTTYNNEPTCSLSATSVQESHNPRLYFNHLNSMKQFGDITKIEVNGSEVSGDYYELAIESEVINSISVTIGNFHLVSELWGFTSFMFYNYEHPKINSISDKGPILAQTSPAGDSSYKLYMQEGDLSLENDLAVDIVFSGEPKDYTVSKCLDLHLGANVQLTYLKGIPEENPTLFTDYDANASANYNIYVPVGATLKVGDQTHTILDKENVQILECVDSEDNVLFWLTFVDLIAGPLSKDDGYGFNSVTYDTEFYPSPSDKGTIIAEQFSIDFMLPEPQPTIVINAGSFEACPNGVFVDGEEIELETFSVAAEIEHTFSFDIDLDYFNGYEVDPYLIFNKVSLLYTNDVPRVKFLESYKSVEPQSPQIEGTIMKVTFKVSFELPESMDDLYWMEFTCGKGKTIPYEVNNEFHSEVTELHYVNEDGTVGAIVESLSKDESRKTQNVFVPYEGSITHEQQDLAGVIIDTVIIKNKNGDIVSRCAHTTKSASPAWDPDIEFYIAKNTDFHDFSLVDQAISNEQYKCRTISALTYKADFTNPRLDWISTLFKNGEEVPNKIIEFNETNMNDIEVTIEIDDSKLPGWASIDCLPLLASNICEYDEGGNISSVHINESDYAMKSIDFSYATGKYTISYAINVPFNTYYEMCNCNGELLMACEECVEGQPCIYRINEGNPEQPLESECCAQYGLGIPYGKIEIKYEYNVELGSFNGMTVLSAVNESGSISRFAVGQINQVTGEATWLPNRAIDVHQSEQSKQIYGEDSYPIACDQYTFGLCDVPSHKNRVFFNPYCYEELTTTYPNLQIYLGGQILSDSQLSVETDATSIDVKLVDSVEPVDTSSAVLKAANCSYFDESISMIHSMNDTSWTFTTLDSISTATVSNFSDGFCFEIWMTGQCVIKTQADTEDLILRYFTFGETGEITADAKLSDVGGLIVVPGNSLSVDSTYIEAFERNFGYVNIGGGGIPENRCHFSVFNRNGEPVLSYSFNLNRNPLYSYSLNGKVISAYQYNISYHPSYF